MIDSTPRLHHTFYSTCKSKHFAVKVATDNSQVADIVDLVNEAFEWGERELWISGTKRTNEEEVRKLLEQGRVIIVVIIYRTDSIGNMFDQIEQILSVIVRCSTSLK